ncbi:tRNA preQ1(34) S-adenosylmethionine ribosyltransferase-isomerase QueA [Thermodesulfobacteriota bacterium]
MFKLQDYDYKLPEELIAQGPAAQRDQSRLLVVDRNSDRLTPRKFYEIYDLLSSSDLMVVNNTKVIPGRLFGRKKTGGKVEVLIIDYAGADRTENDNGRFVCECLIKSSKSPKIGTSIYFDQGLTARVIHRQDAVFTLEFVFSGNFESLLYQIGNVPLPPYVKRSHGDLSVDDRISYQTVYASHKGAIAAPTAGLHFSKKLLEKIESKGIRIVAITLHVSYGTFLPVRVSDIRDHNIHSEWYHIPAKTADAINRWKASGGRIVAVGTTCVRTLEYAADERGNIAHGSGNCDIFIYPGYKFKAIDALLTNFHLPQSTLLMLVAAFAGRKKILKAYRAAIDKGYRFYSYGDAMYII